ncbi:glucose-1-phosphate thymidylyltransferase [Salipaludibacillus aurantiacus]|uniref:Glucose-1-phosphate thymidylyltransferase n=1 Tax=Salipaludibacillus aurantiacus TaxID=1601833 RepID=A0A1H9X6S2_9BACI|nr:glucose-1-phosphate thymidylyltransferase [Salipaludibacillus aurantiacus]SES41822.1 glucose-1-phosphate thymidylyltransferase [Salipaludibacillus aurantiacus]
MKGLILGAGKGTRLRPFTYTQPKPLLPVANQPVILYGLTQLMKLGINEIGIVIHPEQEESFKQVLKSVNDPDLTVTYIYQTEQKGIGHAVMQAKSFIGKHPFVLLLGDNLICEPLLALRDQFNKKGIHSTVLVKEVSHPEDYGIAEIKDKKIVNLEEKPSRPKSNLAVIGAYIFTPYIFKAIQSIEPSARGEYEITDAIQWLIDHGYRVNYVITGKPASDVGTVERWLEANKWMLQMENKEGLSEVKEKAQDSIIIPPVKIGKNCEIKQSVIGPYVSVDSGAKIEKCSIRNSVVLKGARLENVPFEISDSIVGEGASVSGSRDAESHISGIFPDKSSVIIPDKQTTFKKKEGGT